MTDDLISRQDAINLIHKTIYEFFDIVDNESEEPMSEKDKLLLEVNKAISNRTKELPSALRWIPVKERLPEEKGRYLVSGGVKGNRKIWLCDFVVIANVHGWINDASNPVVNAWMPLPEPYKEKNNVEIY